MENQTRVKNTKDGRTGTTCPDLMSCCTPDEVPVVYDGETAFLGTLESNLEIIGPENAVPEPSGCGAGKGANCCIYLTVGAKGFECERYSSMRHHFLFKQSSMNAKRNPVEPFPLCMNQGSALATPDIPEG